MSLFNFRRPGSTSAANTPSGTQTESVEVVRKRAKHRLIGSVVLVLIGVIGFPLLFDTQPRPIAIDIPIEIPGKASVKPLALPAASPQSGAPVAKASSAVAAVTAPVAAPMPPTPSEKVTAAASLAAREEILTEKNPVAPAKPEPFAAKTEAKESPKPAPKIEVSVASQPAPAADDGNRAKALLDGKPELAVAPAATKSVSVAAVAAPAATATEGRMVVQVGAFADVEKAREAQSRLERAGLKTYTQVVETAGGKRIRVRVGPFATKAEADKAASKIKTLDLPAAVLTL